MIGQSEQLICQHDVIISENGARAFKFVRKSSNFDTVIFLKTLTREHIDWTCRINFSTPENIRLVDHYTSYLLGSVGGGSSNANTARESQCATSAETKCPRSYMKHNYTLFVLLSLSFYLYLLSLYGLSNHRTQQRHGVSSIRKHIGSQITIGLIQKILQCISSRVDWLSIMTHTVIHEIQSKSKLECSSRYFLSKGFPVPSILVVCLVLLIKTKEHEN